MPPRPALAPTLPALLASLALAACATPAWRPPGGSAGTPVPVPEGSGVPTPVPSTPLPEPAPVPAPVPVPKSYRLGAATSALVSQAQGASARGDYETAAATLERALRIEPDNPLVWIEMGRARLAGGDPVQAENMGRRALALAAGAPREQASARQLIADAQSAQ